MKLLVKNIARIVGIESTGRLRCCGADGQIGRAHV